MQACPLCHGPVAPFGADKRRHYFQCQDCALVSADPGSHLQPEAEKALYDIHDNQPGDPGYRRFLSRLATPLLARLAPGSQGLDFGCGPGPALAAMLEEAGMAVALYDPYYAADPAPLQAQYDFVTSTEVVEHFNSPAESWALLAGLVKPGGWLGVMTKLVIDQDRFANWHYKNDPTHVSFHSEATFAWLAEHFGFDWQRVDTDVILLQKR
ncbi:class I SAM-dependent methyltransferase [Gallaecimonas kandeliae]|uniref:class I SAM-dependent methyltransferase n=1 Tax=Gallaecimonas kandeliae TaxID=3029055 RepID=UPI002649E8A1|nr:class I SAM-dependent methyltransferase [Gallaecimonas kandeliae]WKE65451.1 class I SAM-dependent methyltransferase [Gallaecimonas kandeliae]